MTAFIKAARDRQLVSDPCLARLIFASRALLGLVAVAVVGWFLSGSLGFNFSGVMLGVVASHFSLLLARQPARRTRISTSLIMIPGYWLGLILIHGVAGQPALQIVLLPILVGLGFWLQNGRSRLATMIMAAAWIFMFTIYFQAQDGSLIWHLMVVSVSVPIMMVLRFMVWSEDRPVSPSLIQRSHQLILIRAAQRASRSEQIADVLGWLHRSMVPVIQSLEAHPDIDAATRAALLDRRRAVEIELLRAPARGAEIAGMLAENPDAGSVKVSYGLPVLAHIAEPQDAEAEEKTASAQSSSANISRRRAIQVTAAVLPAALAGFLISPERWPWAVLVAMFMFLGTENSGRLLSKGVQNIVGVIAGVALAIVLSNVLPPMLWLGFAVIMMLTFLAFYLIPAHYAAGMAAVTALIGQALALGGGDIAMLLQLRLSEVLVGAAFGLFAGLCVMPEKASDNVRRACANLLNDVANVLDPDQAGPGTARLRDGLAAAYTAADFGRLSGLLIDGTGMRVALIEMAQLQHLTELYRHLKARSEGEIPTHYLYELARRCRATAEQVVNRRREILTPLSWPDNASPELGVLAAIDASVQAIARQG
ncbi:fusaric acid resistance family protein [Marinobacter pelagius]|uniref:Fusaric acid resistance family protein n=1 Tax=Marinobacter pelagius TaxID=379482 RepID=A0A366GVP2_9GAMM|nr:FUSC family protein [Marinobacter pelagius]RBP31897.1 fusaric acid resistance family protein [Marinobacter pelagius]